jgi:hypothetical protein
VNPVLVAVRSGARRIPDIADATGLSPYKVRAAARELEQMRLIEITIPKGEPGATWHLTPRADPDRLTLSTSTAFQRPGEITLDPTMREHLDHAIDQFTLEHRRTTAPHAADMLGMSYHDALGALWRNVHANPNAWNVTDHEGLHAVFIRKRNA